MEQTFNFPTEEIELPSRGLIYPESNPLSSGKIIMKYMTAKEEDILTNQSYINKGIVLDKLLQSLIITKIDYNDLVIGDKNAILIASRVLAFGPEYSITVTDPAENEPVEVKVDMSNLKHKNVEIGRAHV